MQNGLCRGDKADAVSNCPCKHNNVMVMGKVAWEGREKLHLNGKNIESTFHSLLLESRVYTGSLHESSIVCFSF